MALRVAPRFPSISTAVRGFRRLPRFLARSAAPPSASAESPQLPHPPVVPAMECAGRPVSSHPSALPALEIASCPAAPLFQPRLPTLPPGRPGFHVLWRCRGVRLRVAPNPAALSVAASASLGLPLGPASAAGSMMNPWRARTLHPQLAPRMNLRVQSGLAHSCLTVDAVSISFRLPTLRLADFLKSLHAFCCQAGTAYPIPYRVTNCLESRTDRSVHASVNLV